MTDARIIKSQRALMSAGIKALNKNKGITLSEIAKEAGVGRATLYRLYDTKEALVEAIAIWCLQTFDEETKTIEDSASSYLHAFELLFEVLMPFTEEFRFLSELEYFSEYSPNIRAITEQQDNTLRELIESAKLAGEIDPSIPTSWVLNLINALFHAGWCQQEQNGASSKEASELAYVSFQRVVTA